MLERYALIKVMKAVLSSPRKRFSVRGAAKASGVSVNAGKQSLDFMRGRKLVTLERIGRSCQYQADLDSCMARQWKILFSLDELDDAGVVDRILRTRKSILGVILYGSAATGRDDENSDIDIIVIADTDRHGKKEIAGHARGTKRELNISVYSPYEWKEKARNDRIFYDHVIMDSIALYGEKPVVV